MSASGLRSLPEARCRRRHLLWPLLLGAHLALWLLPDRAPPQRPAVAGAVASMQLRLLAPKPRLSAAMPRPPLARPVLAPPLAVPLLQPPSIEITTPATAAAPPAEAATAGPAQGPAATATSSGNSPAPLIVRIPAAGKPGQFTPWHNPATQDPRSRSIRLTFEEKMAIAAGTPECFLEEREPDGSIWRGPGKLRHRASASSLTGAAASAGGMVTVCVR